VEMVKKAWGDAAPEWVTVLALACDASSQSAVSKRLGAGASTGVVNSVLQNKYTGRMDKVEARVRGELMNEHVRCPVLGDITKRRCLDQQTRPYSATNALRVELHRACPRCHNAIGSGK
jgi:hypothetical protein